MKKISIVKKTFNIIIILISLGAFAFGVYWTVKNWGTLTSKTNLYTQSDMNDYGDDRYQAGLEQGEEWKTLVVQYREQISEMEGNVNNLTILLEQEKGKNNQNTELITTLETTLTSLQTQITALQDEVERLEELLKGYEDLKKLTCQINFKIGTQNYYSTVVKFGDKFDDSTLPEYTAEDRLTYMAELNGWTVDGVEVDFDTYQIGADTTFEAITTPVYTVNFDVENEELNQTYYITEGHCMAEDVTTQNIDSLFYIAQPQKEGYVFNGLTLNGIDAVENIADMAITEDLTFNAIWLGADKIDTETTWTVAQPVNPGETVTQKANIEMPEIISNCLFTYQNEATNDYGQAHFGELIEFANYSVAVNYENGNFVFDFKTTETIVTSFSINNIFNVKEIRFGNYSITERSASLYAKNLETNESTKFEIDNISEATLIYTNPQKTDIFVKVKDNETGLWKLFDIDQNLVLTEIGANFSNIEVYTESITANWDIYADFKVVSSEGTAKMFRYKYADKTMSIGNIN